MIELTFAAARSTGGPSRGVETHRDKARGARYSPLSSSIAATAVACGASAVASKPNMEDFVLTIGRYQA